MKKRFKKLMFMISIFLIMMQCIVNANNEIDITPPKGSISIRDAYESGDTFHVDKKSIILDINVTDDQSESNEIEMYISTTPIDLEKGIPDSLWETYTSTKTLRLSGDINEYDIYTAFRDKTGNVSKNFEAFYEINFDANGGTDAPISQIASFGKAITLTDRLPEFKGKYFRGWSLSADDTSKIYSPGEILPANMIKDNFTLYAVWTDNINELPLLSEKVKIGDYINYPVSYENVKTYQNDNKSIYNTWRVLSIEEDGTINIVSAGVPLTYYHAEDASTSVNNLSDEFLVTNFSTTEDNTYRKNGFKTQLNLIETFSNKYTLYDGTTPVVRAMNLEDVQKAIGTTEITTELNLNKEIENLFNTGAYTYLGTNSSDTSLWYITNNGVLSNKTSYNNTELGIRVVVSLKPTVTTSGKDVYGRWNLETEEEVVVTLDSNDGTSAKQRKILKYTSEYGELPELSRAGYNFSGWYTSKLGGNLVTETTVITNKANHYIYARWEPRTDTEYKVNHWLQNLDGLDEENEDNYTKVIDGTQIYTAVTDTKVTPEVNSYDGFESPQKITTTVKGDGSTEINYYYKRNSYNLTVVAGENILSVSGSGKYKYGQNVTIKATLTTIEGYDITFTGWTVDGVVNQTSGETSILMPANNIEFTATAEKTVKKYTLSLDGNGGTVSGEQIGTKTIEYFGTYGELPVPIREGYTFEGWYTEREDGILITEATAIKTEDHTLYARWTRAYAIYSTDDNSLRFYQTTEIIKSGDTYNDLIVSDVFTGFDTTTYTSASQVPWNDYGNLIKTVKVEDEIKPLSTAYWFYELNYATEIDVTNLNTSNVTNMNSMFYSVAYSTTELELIGLEYFDTTNVQTMERMFQYVAFGVPKFSLNGISNWNTTNVTNMKYMFSNFCRNSTEMTIDDMSTKEITRPDGTKYTAWDTTNVKDMMCLFYNAARKVKDVSLNLSGWNLENVTNMSYMFYNLKADAYATTGEFEINGINTWKNIKASDMSYMFANVANNLTDIELDLTGLVNSNVTNISYMFNEFGRNSNSIKLIGLNTWDTSNVTDMSFAFTNMGINTSELIRLDLSSWNTLKASDMSNMFGGMNKLYQITLGENFNFKGNGRTSCVLPTPNATYIVNADGYWYNNSGDKIAPASVPSLKADTYLAVSGYYITFDTNGGTEIEDIKVRPGKEVTPPENPTKPGYKFIGWDKEIPQVMPEENITITAIWEARTDTPYKVEHWLQNVNAEDTESELYYTRVEDGTQYYTGTTDTEISPNVNTYEGFISPEVKIETIAGDGTTVVNYYYKRRSYNLTVIAGDNIETVTGGGSYHFDADVAINAILKTEIGHDITFDGWYLDGKVNQTTEKAYIRMPTQDITLTAKATKTVQKYTVTLNYNDGRLDDSMVVTYGETYAGLPIPTRAGCDFLGWYTDLVDGEEIKAADTVTITHDHTLYARWENALMDLIPSIANEPVLGDGMKAVYWTGEDEKTEVTADKFTKEMYSYERGNGIDDSKDSKWANAITTADGSYWVWIPRYAYKITYTDSTKTIESGEKTNYGFIDILFLYGSGDYYRDGNGNPQPLPEGYKIHPAFQAMEPATEGKSGDAELGNPLGKWDKELQGIWVAKYEASQEKYVDGEWVANNDPLTAGGGNALAVENSTRVVVKPSRLSWNKNRVDYIYRNCLNMNTDLNTHLIKNSEWGAATYLAYSNYGRNGNEISVNQNYVMNGTDAEPGYTGGGPGLGDGIIYNGEYEYVSGEFESTYAWDTVQGQKASTTGNKYGIYDLSGGSWEAVAAHTTVKTNNLTSATNGGELGNTTDMKMKQIYKSSGTTSKNTQEYDFENYASQIYGDAVYETSVDPTQGLGWYTDYSHYPTKQYVFFGRGGDFSSVYYCGPFYYDMSTGAGEGAIVGYRPALCVE